MLRVAVTGGIGSGKSTASARLAELGAVVVDSDKLARDVVAIGTPGLAAIERRFSTAVLGPDGALDRAALAAIVFSEPAARRDLEGIIHPRVRQEFVRLAAAAAPETVVVNDIPLLTQLSVAAQFHLVIGIGADAVLRVQRLIGRGLSEDDARARLAAQIDDAVRRPLTDAWLDNNGTPDELRAQIDRLWEVRLQPFNANLLAGRRASPAEPLIAAPDPRWPADAQRLLARVVAAAGDAALSADHIGSTAVPGLPAKDVIDLQLGVASLEVAEEIAPLLSAAGFSAVDGVGWDTPHPADPAAVSWPKRFHASADPGRPAHLHVRVVGGPGWTFALRFRDWLRADDTARYVYAQHKAAVSAEFGESSDSYATAKEPWLEGAWLRSSEWAAATGWQPPPVPG